MAKINLKYIHISIEKMWILIYNLKRKCNYKEEDNDNNFNCFNTINSYNWLYNRKFSI